MNAVEKWAALIGVIQNVVVIAGTIFGVVLGWQGLSAWRREHLGKEKFAQGRELLRALYRYRTALENAFRYLKRERGPGADVQEYYPPLEKIVEETRTIFMAQALEAEIVSGIRFTRLTALCRLRTLPFDLHTAYLEQLGLDMSEHRDDITAIMGGRFEEQLRESVEALECEIAPLLGR